MVVKLFYKSFLFSFLLIFIVTLVYGDGEKIVKYNDIYYSINREHGFEVLKNGNKFWAAFNRGLPDKVVYPFDNLSKRNFTSISVNTDNTDIYTVTTINSLYITKNSGLEWKKVALRSPVKDSSYIIASSVRGEAGDNILLATSFSGIFDTNDGGKTWKSYKEILSGFYRGAGFYEDISAVAYGKDSYSFFFATGFGKKLFYYTKTGKDPVITEIKIPQYVTNSGEITGLLFENKNNSLHVYCNNYMFVYNSEADRWLPNIEVLPVKKKEIDKNLSIRKNIASEKRGIYLASTLASGKKIDNYFTFINANNMNSIVVDFKDDQGVITYSTKNRTAAEAGAVRNRIDIADFISKAHNQGIYVIARIVVFKDRFLYNYQKNKYALWDNVKNAAWGNLVESADGTFEQKEFWVDPYCEFVWDYNISIAEELQSLGVDEIQFDYIRFPTDGDLSTIKYRYNAREGMIKSDALESFLKKAREKISLPISVDLYGFNAWYKKGNWNGQQIDMFANYADIICPMYYPSHFPADFPSNIKAEERAEAIYNEGTLRSIEIAGNRSIIRPYVQAFLVGGERKFEEFEYYRYLNMQLKGLYNAGAVSFTLWNASGNYYMVSSSTALIYKN